MTSLILFVFILAFSKPIMAWEHEGCFDNFTPCMDFIQGRRIDPSPLCCQNINAIEEGQQRPKTKCKCIEYFATYNESRIQELPLKCNTLFTFPITDCSRVSISVVDEEMMMESDISRRILAESGYVSRDAMRRDRIPCNERGRSYYSCRDRQQANPYNRGCTIITHCARVNR